MTYLRKVQIFLLLALFAFVQGTRADAPSMGAPAPDFRLQDQHGKWHRLSEYRGKWVALYFYPKDQSPGCTTQACDFRDNIFGFKQANAQILGISTDDVESHKKFSDKYSLPFPILADPDKKAVAAYGVLSFTGFAKRETFLISPRGVVMNRYVVGDPKGHSEAVLKDIKQLQQKSN